MTAKIFRNSFFVGLLVLLAAGILFLSVMYANDETLAFDELETEMAVLAPAVERLGLPYLQELDAAGRVTWIAADGSVLYDNSARKDNMENHLAREEIAAALDLRVSTVNTRLSRGRDRLRRQLQERGYTHG